MTPTPALALDTALPPCHLPSMPRRVPSRRVLLLCSALVLLSGGGAALALWPDDEPPAAPGDDSGLTDAQAEALMREIGYVQ